MGARQFAAIAHERQPRFQTRIVGHGDDRTLQTLAGLSDQQRRVGLLRGQSGNERAAGKDAGAIDLAKPPRQILAEPRFIEPLVNEGRENRLGLIERLDPIELHPPGACVALDHRRGRRDATGRGAKIEAHQRNGLAHRWFAAMASWRSLVVNVASIRPPLHFISLRARTSPLSAGTAGAALASADCLTQPGRGLTLAQRASGRCEKVDNFLDSCALSC